MKIIFLIFSTLAVMLLSGCNETPDTTVTPAPEQYAVSVTRSENGDVSATVDGQPVTQAEAGAEITIAATPNEGYIFMGWTVIGASLTGEAAETATFTMPEGDVTVEAEFAAVLPTEYGITVTTVENGEVAVTAGGIAVQRAVAGTEIVIAATPNKGFLFVGWTLAGAEPKDAADRTTTFTMPEGDVTIAVEFGGDPFDDAGVVIQGVRWATRNVDAPGTFAETPESAGMFYQYGRKVGWSATDPLVNSAGGTTWNPTEYVGTWTADNDPSPDGWRVPTAAEIGNLINAGYVNSSFIKDPVPGIMITEKSSGNSIFLPVCGSRAATDGSLNRVDGGFYWSIAPYGGSDYYMYCDEYDEMLWDIEVTLIYTLDRNIGLNIRPVAIE